MARKHPRSKKMERSIRAVAKNIETEMKRDVSQVAKDIEDQRKKKTW